MAGLLFCPATVHPAYKRLHCVLCSQCKLYSPHCKTVHRALQGLFLRFAPFYSRRYQTDKSGYNTACATLERITAPGRSPAHTRYHRHAGRCTGQHSRPIIIRYIRVQRCSIPQTMPARRLVIWHRVSSRGAAVGAEPLAAAAASLFGLSPDS